MKATIRYLATHKGVDVIIKPFAIIKEKVKPGDYVAAFGVLAQVNQSTSIYYDRKVIGPVNELISVTEGEEVELVFDCKAESNCNYPFCGNACPGNKAEFRILGKEQRKY